MFWLKGFIDGAAFLPAEGAGAMFRANRRSPNNWGGGYVWSVARSHITPAGGVAPQTTRFNHLIPMMRLLLSQSAFAGADRYSFTRIIWYILWLPLYAELLYTCSGLMRVVRPL